jgi:tetratricopeptide (TPR) repeat protein
MENNLEIQEKIQAYLTRTMPTQERVIFEAQLRTDATLREEVSFYELMTTTFQITNGKQNVQNMVQDIAKEKPLVPDFSDFEPKSTSIYSKGIAALGIMALLIVGGFLFFQHQQNAQHIERLKNLVTSMATPMEMLIAIPDVPSDALTLGVQAYEQRNYALAIEQLQKHLQVQPKDVFAVLYLGISQYFLGEKDKTIKTLLPLTTIQEPINYASQWYIALSYISKGDINKAKSFLQILADTKEYGEKAKQLLKDM